MGPKWAPVQPPLPTPIKSLESSVDHMCVTRMGAYVHIIKHSVALSIFHVVFALMHISKLRYL
jgi:hypothetical protein